MSCAPFADDGRRAAVRRAPPVRHDPESFEKARMSLGSSAPSVVDCKSINPNILAINEAYIVTEYPVPKKF